MLTQSPSTVPSVANPGVASAMVEPPRPAVPAPVLVPPAATKPKIDPRLIVCLAAVYLVWSSTYLAMRIVVAEIPPLVMVSLRFCAAGGVLFAIAKRRGAAWPSARQWLAAAPIGALLFGGGTAFVAIGELTVSSGGAAVVCATMPVWLGVLAAVTGERPSLREWLSLITGLAGVLVLMGGPSLAGRPLHVGLVILSPMCWALGSILARRAARSSGLDTLMASATQMLTGSVVLGLGAAVARERVPMHASAHAWLALGYLLVFGSLIGFTAYGWLLRNARPVVASSYAYVNPILAVLVGAVVSNEQLGITTLIANVLIVGAIALALTKPRPH
jgi:drug/metabolite transporter (DMT)-like permease